MNRFFIAGLACLLASSVARADVADPAGLLKQGHDAWQEGDYGKAASLYGNLAKDGFESADLFYNLGTANLRAGQRGEAILWFERALRLDPHDDDVAFNLAEAQKGNIDKIVGAREEASFIERVGERVPGKAAGVAFAVTWIFAFAAFCLRQLSTKGRGFLLALGLASAAFALVSATLLWTVWWHRTHARYAIVTARSTPVREGPAKDFRSAFEIHEGLKVRVVKDADGFLRVRLPNGTEGWVAGKDVPVI